VASRGRMDQDGWEECQPRSSRVLSLLFGTTPHLSRLRLDSSTILLNRLIFEQTPEQGLHILITFGAVNLKSAAQALDARHY
jgi:hypothetical protein